eukprot:gb/GECG01004858.1/.p1 GENE.gb/GECG01004858.1/~~gb/GECG01004858.1/.p1  ORF type:complete len:198 (+),score=21.77 gb/GECG01004858.1/:1-594(+)
MEQEKHMLFGILMEPNATDKDIGYEIRSSDLHSEDGTDGSKATSTAKVYAPLGTTHGEDHQESSHSRSDLLLDRFQKALDAYIRIHKIDIAGSNLDTISRAIVLWNKHGGGLRPSKDLTLIVTAALYGHHNVMNLLIQKYGARARSKAHSLGHTPLHAAALGGQLHVVKTLVNHYGVDPEIKASVNGFTVHIKLSMG